MITINGKLYIESNNIKVFPCTYRGYYNSSTTPVTALVFDPEARATTEANFTSTFHRLSDNKKSYAVAWVPGTDPNYPNAGTLKCVIGGYYFEIYNHTIDQFFYTADGEPTPYYLCIKTDQITLGTSGSDAARATTVLSSFANTTNYLDVKDGNDYAFTGLLISTTADGDGDITASLAPFMAVPNGVEGAEDYAYKIDPATLPITNLLDVGNGSYSIRMVAGDTDTTEASGDYSVALGQGTKATGEASTALGNSTEASAKGAFAAGNATKAIGEGTAALGNNTTASGTNAVALGDTTIASGVNSVALGSHTTASEANQVVIGQYNAEDTEQAFIIANGEDDSNKSNKFTVSYDGDVKALGTLETKGSIKATGTTANGLELGTNNIEGSYGSITVFGENLPNKITDAGGNEIQPDKIPVFKVESTGNTTIAGATTITNETEYTSPATGALLVSGGVGVAKNLNVGGSTTLNNTLTVSGNHLTTLGGNLQVSGDTTLTQKLTVTEVTQLNNNLSVAGNTTIAASTANDGTSATNTLVIGNTTTNISGALDIYGTGAEKVFSVTNTGNTTIAGTTSITGTTTLKNITTITKDTEYTAGDDFDKTTAALKVAGGVHIDKKLNVGGTTTLNDTLTVADGKTTTLGGATTLKDNLTVADGKTTTLGGSTIIKGTTACSIDGKEAALKVAGGVTIGKNLYVTESMSLSEKIVANTTQMAISATTESEAFNQGALVVTGGVGIGGKLNVNKNTSIAGNLTVAGTSGTANILQLGNNSTSNKGGELLIYGTGTTTVFSVDNTGNTGLEGNLTVKGNISSDSKLSIGSGATAIEISSTGITGLSGLTVTGQINATVFNAASDARLKTDIKDYKFEKSITSLPIKQFEYIKDETHTKYIGCLAQDLQEICPELVNESPDGTLSIQESKLVYALLQEVKELKEKVDRLERK